MVYGEFKDLPRRTASDKVFPDKAFNIAKIQNMMNINKNLLQWFIASIKNQSHFYNQHEAC